MQNKFYKAKHTFGGLQMNFIGQNISADTFERIV